MSNEKKRLFDAIEYFIDDNLDVASLDTFLDLYGEKRREIWCPDDSDHYMVPDHCNLPEHFFCMYCGKRCEEII